MTSNITKDQFTQGGPFFSMSLAVMLHHSVGGIVPCIPNWFILHQEMMSRVPRCSRSSEGF